MTLVISTYPTKVHEEAQHTIGEIHHNKQGDKFSYVEFTGGASGTTYPRGIVVRDANVADLISGTTGGTVTAAAAAGTTRLVDDGEFTGKDLRGAIGTIYEGAGIGQHFVVKSVVDDDTLEIQILKHGGDGWETALGTDSDYRLSLPGRVYKASASVDERARGVTVYEEFTVPANEFRYGYVRQTGIDEGLIDVSDQDLAFDDAVIRTTDGLIIGRPGTDTIGAIRRTVGYSVNGNTSAGGTNDHTMLIEFNIVNHRRSYRRPRLREEPKISVE